MTHFRSLIVVFLAYLILPVQASDLASLPIIKVSAAGLDLPPVAHLGKQGRASGRAIETVRRLCEIGRMQCDFHIYSAAAAYTSIERGRHDILLTARYERFEKCCTFSAWHYLSYFGIYSDLPVESIPENEAELQGNKIIIIRGWQSPYRVFPGLDSLIDSNKIDVAYSNSVVSSIGMFEKGRAQFLWGSQDFRWHVNHLDKTTHRWNFKQLTVIRGGLWVSRNSEFHDEILKRIALAYGILKKNGSLIDGMLTPELMGLVYEDAPAP